MKTSEAVVRYVEHRQLMGCEFSKGRKHLNEFTRLVIDKQLSEITVRDVAAYVGKGTPSTCTWRSRYLTLRKFLRFWVSREAMPVVAMPTLPKPVESEFMPYVYSRGEVKRLLALTRKITDLQTRSIDAKTFRTLLITLYATGAFVGELVRLSWKDVDLEKGLITLRQIRFSRVRTIPISEELTSILQVHQKRQPSVSDEVAVFVRRDGDAITSDLATRAFMRIRRKAGFQHGSGQTPRLHDFRTTFAVHRIEDWIRKGSDLNRLLPALSAYMGASSLMRSERFMNLAPERFRRELSRLSPKRAKQHWRNDAALMSFLNSL